MHQVKSVLGCTYLPDQYPGRPRRPFQASDPISAVLAVLVSSRLWRPGSWKHFTGEQRAVSYRAGPVERSAQIAPPAPARQYRHFDRTPPATQAISIRQQAELLCGDGPCKKPNRCSGRLATPSLSLPTAGGRWTRHCARDILTQPPVRGVPVAARWVPVWGSGPNPP